MSTDTVPQTRPSWELWVTGAAVIAVAAALAWMLNLAAGLGGWPAYAEWAAPGSSVSNWVLWVVGDTNEAQFYKSFLGGVGMTAGALGAWWLLKRNPRVAGFPVSYGTGLLGWILASSWLSLVLANVLFQWTITPKFPWQPTFVTFVSVSAAVVLVYGGGWPTVLTAAVLGAVLTTPISILVVDYICIPLGLPAVVGNVTGMWAGGLIAFALCRVLPWMKLPAPAPPSTEEPPPAPAPQTPVWLARRTLADFTEPQFYGNEWASAGLLFGVMLEFLLNPSSPVYGSGILPAVFVAQVIAAVLGILLFRKQWRAHGWYPTFIPIVSVAPAIVLTVGSTPLLVVLAGVLGAVTGPPVGAYIASKLPKDVHPYVGYVMSMTICSAILVPLVSVIF